MNVNGAHPRLFAAEVERMREQHRAGRVVKQLAYDWNLKPKAVRKYLRGGHKREYREAPNAV